MKYYLAIEKEILPFAKIWVNLEGIMLCEVSQKKYILMISFTCGL